MDWKKKRDHKMWESRESLEKPEKKFKKGIKNA